ncbi:ATP-binding protein [Allonocardiopsis opalescens]|uniref:Histidine kinase-like protein n=1 Tax=Allonocardiopsis opalescens TaxID=1144618 RepID=A0A2T0PYR8_9ACTN|nr:ATP-binding protein [Allonocardiopsis opalescens]PRX96680.1 histidine kinase-like protein [Allonocardiopsis opalescens]
MIAAESAVLAPVPAAVESVCEFPGDPESVGLVRAWVQRELVAERAGLSAVPVDVVHLGVLLVAELAANAVQHSDSFRTGGMFAVHVERERSRVRVAVKDEGPADGYLPKVVHVDRARLPLRFLRDHGLLRVGLGGLRPRPLPRAPAQLTATGTIRPVSLTGAV